MKRKIIVYFLLWLYFVFLIWDFNNDPGQEILKKILDILSNQVIIFGVAFAILVVMRDIIAFKRFKNEKKPDDYFNNLIKKYAILFFAAACIGIFLKFVSEVNF